MPSSNEIKESDSRDLVEEKQHVNFKIHSKVKIIKNEITQIGMFVKCKRSQCFFCTCRKSKEQLLCFV